MRILFVNHNADLYGASRSLLRLASRLHADGNNIAVAMPSDGPLRVALESAGVRTLVEPHIAVVERSVLRSTRGRVKFLAELPISVWHLRRLMGRLRPDVVHANTSVLAAAGMAARLARVRIVLHVREFYDEFPALWPAYRRWLTLTSDRIVCVSQAVADRFGPAAKRVMVLHNGFPAGEFAPVSAERVDAFRRRFGVDTGRLAGVLGRIKLGRKGQETFVAAAGLLRDRLPDARFMIIGAPFAGNETHQLELERQARELGLGHRVVFTGELADVRAAYAALDVVVLPSGQPEPFGGVVIEAMAMGRPVVGTAIGGTPEQIDDGVTGRLVPPGDPAAMAAALDELLEDEPRRAAMGRRARTRFEERFEFEPFYRRMLGVYREMGAS
jgi:glycosyltransferase involved in cell wall biosynthesis